MFIVICVPTSHTKTFGHTEIILQSNNDISDLQEHRKPKSPRKRFQVKPINRKEWGSDEDMCLQYDPIRERTFIDLDCSYDTSPHWSPKLKKIWMEESHEKTDEQD